MRVREWHAQLLLRRHGFDPVRGGLLTTPSPWPEAAFRRGRTSRRPPPSSPPSWRPSSRTQSSATRRTRSQRSRPAAQRHQPCIRHNTWGDITRDRHGEGKAVRGQVRDVRERSVAQGGWSITAVAELSVHSAYDEKRAAAATIVFSMVLRSRRIGLRAE